MILPFVKQDRQAITYSERRVILEVVSPKYGISLSSL